MTLLLNVLFVLSPNPEMLTLSSMLTVHREVKKSGENEVGCMGKLVPEDTVVWLSLLVNNISRTYISTKLILTNL